MILHLYNCDNDMALANFSPGYTPPANIQRYMTEHERLPLQWAQPGEAVLCHDGVWLKRERGDAERLSVAEAVARVTELRPWGWSPAVCHRLRQLGFPAALMPTASHLQELRRLSSRERAVELLPPLLEGLATATEGGATAFVGASVFCRSEAEVAHALQRWPRTILKAPWSSSGKGLRLGQGGQAESLGGWCRRILQQQGGVVVEPLYDKACDFAMEFFSDGVGRVRYRGLSVFDTSETGAYLGNMRATEEARRAYIEKRIDAGLASIPSGVAGGAAVSVSPHQRLSLLAARLEDDLSARLGGVYRGPLGVDMMVLQDGSIHPCVEINLRMTMGYVAMLLA
ncbi:MAG: hypothetical protein KBT12_00200 [Bacteroidales bacterium]|nr:hypothetical protein [Candidatus Physcousia equi]